MKANDELEIKLLIECQEHIPELARLWFEEISKHWVPGASVERATQNLLAHSNHDKMPMTYVALYQGKPIGMASLRENDGIRPDLIPWLGSVVVDPAFRKQKVGERLIRAIKNQAKVFGYNMLYLLAFDQTIPEWYSRLGWEMIGTDKLFEYPVSVMQIKL